MSRRAEALVRVLTPLAVTGVFAGAVAAVVMFTPTAPAPMPAHDQSNSSLPPDLRKAYDKLGEAQRDLQARLVSLNDELDRTRSELRDARAHRDDLDATASAAAPGDSPSGSERRAVVQAVDNKTGIYVISVGTKDAVRVGMEFEVRRGTERIGSIVIDRAFPNYATGSRSPGSPAFELRADDVCTPIGVIASRPK